MPDECDKTRSILARNLRYLMDEADFSEHRLAKKAGMGQKTINNILRQRSSLTTDKLTDLARAFQMDSWMLLLPDLPILRKELNGLRDLMGLYARSAPEGRQLIRQIAAREADHASRTTP